VAPSDDVWFATSGGAARLSLGTMTAFTTNDGMPSNQCRAIAIDVISVGGGDHEVAWVATQNGLARVDAVVDSVVALGAADGLPSVDLRSVAVDPNHHKIVGHQNPSGTFHYDGL
jgi:ligand-binding sensor domain-containing protein